MLLDSRFSRDCTLIATTFRQLLVAHEKNYKIMISLVHSLTDDVVEIMNHEQFPTRPHFLVVMAVWLNRVASCDLQYATKSSEIDQLIQKAKTNNNYLKLFYNIALESFGRSYPVLNISHEIMTNDMLRTTITCIFSQLFASGIRVRG